jgi:hypothetical protein
MKHVQGKGLSLFVSIAGVERVGTSPGFGLFMKPLDVCIQLSPVDPPNAPAPELDSGQLTGSDDGIRLGGAHIEISRDVLECQQSRLDSRGARPLRRRASLCHRAVFPIFHIRNFTSLKRQLPSFSSGCSHLALFAPSKGGRS